MNKNNFIEMQDALFHIHSCAAILEKEALANDNPDLTNNKTSNESLSLSQIIGEKAEFCIRIIDKSGLTRT